MTRTVPSTVVQEARIVDWVATGAEKVPSFVAFGIPDPDGRAEELVRDLLRHLVRRHSALRMAFPFPDGTRAVVLDPDEVEVEVEVAPPGTSDADLSRMLERPFDLARWPLFRLCVRHDGETLVFAFSVDHAVFDGVSWTILAREITHLIGLDRARWPEALGPAGDFAAYGERQRTWLASAAARESIGHWVGLCERYGTFPALAGRTAPEPDDDGEPFVTRLDVARLRARCGAERATPAQLVVAAALRAQHRDGAAPGAMLATHGRVWRDVIGTIGNFSNHVPVWLRDERQAVPDVRTQLVAALRHDAVPYKVIIDETVGAAYWQQPEREPYLFVNVPFAPGPAPGGRAAATVVRMWPHPLPYTGAKFDDWSLLLTTPGAEQAALTCVYNPDLDGRSAVRSFVERTVATLDGEEPR